MDMSVFQNINNILDVLPELEQALYDGDVRLSLYNFGRINPLLLDIYALVNPTDNTNSDIALSALVETCAIQNQCLLEIKGFYCDQNQLSIIQYLRHALLNIRPIVYTSTEETLSQNLEDFFSVGDGYSIKFRFVGFCLILVGVAIGAGLTLAVDLPLDAPLRVDQA